MDSEDEGWLCEYTRTLEDNQDPRLRDAPEPLLEETNQDKEDDVNKEYSMKDVEDDYGDLFCYIGTQEEEDELYSQEMTYVASPKTPGRLGSTRPSTAMEDGFLTGEDDLRDHPTPYVGQGGQSPPLGIPGGSPKTPGYQWSKMLLMEDDCFGIQEEDEEDDFWKHPLSYVSLGETPEPTKKVGGAFLTTRSQEDLGDDLVPSQVLLPSTTTLEDDVVEDDHWGSTTLSSSQAELSVTEQRGPFDVSKDTCAEGREGVFGGTKYPETHVDSHGHVDGDVGEGIRMVEWSQQHVWADPSGGEKQQLRTTVIGK